MLDLTTYQFEDHDVRIVMRGDDPWFVAADVCAVLGIANSRDAVGRLDDDERGVAVLDTLGGRQTVNTVSESGLYVLVFTSRLPAARRFRKWVTSDLLPALRRTGAYQMSDAPRTPDPVPFDIENQSDRTTSNALAMVRETRILRGKQAAIRLWDTLPLPQFEDESPTPSVTCGAVSSQIDRFLRQCCVVSGDRDDSIRSTDLRDAFAIWQEIEGEPGWPDGTIARRLGDAEQHWRSPTGGRFRRRISVGIKYFDGIRLTESFAQTVEAVKEGV
ncbi:MAG: Bro-N domain-containing protein [Paracoccus sp. (in: a-proteobacteria)]|nr:Bro-N domain-containing protein [Paracoccus sp. (in: a-proteobacteria)]